MENASKALIIAGAILIAILLISIGIIAMNSINGTLSQTEEEADVMAVQMYNSKFTQYLGEQKGTKVQELLRLMSSPYMDDAGTSFTVIAYGPITDGGRYDGKNFFKPKSFIRAIIPNETYTVEMIERHKKTTADGKGTVESGETNGYYDTVIIRGTLFNRWG